MSGLLRGEVREFDLLSNECAMDFLDFDAITTATIYNGRPPLQSLRARVNEIAVLNPWLTGRLLKKKRSAQVTVHYPVEPIRDVDFLVLKDLNFTASEYNPVKHNPYFEQYFVEKGTACLNKDKPLFRVIVAILNDNQFVLFVSMSHAVADGSTYYSIYNMISSKAQPRALIAERDEACSSVIRSVGLDEAAFFGSMGFIANAVGKIMCHGKHHMAYCRVNPEWIASQKGEYKYRQERGISGGAYGEEAKTDPDQGSLPPLPFISANDIVTSAVFKALNADFGVMPVNYRNRVEGLTCDHCGNYESVVGYCKMDYQLPEHIRASITKRGRGPDVLPVPSKIRTACTLAASVEGAGAAFALSKQEIAALGKDSAELLCGQYKRLHGNKPILPSFCAKRTAVLSFATNWAGFYEEMVVDGCEHVSHFPVFISNAAVIPGAIIYKSDRNTLNILVVQGKPVFVDKLVDLGAVDALW